MRLVLLTLLLMNLNALGMDCATIKSLEEVKELLAKDGKTTRDYEGQLPKAYGFVYLLSTGEVILTSNSKPESQGLLFANEECFQECLRNDRFPIENENKDLFEYDLDGQRNIHQSIGKYHAYLNARLKLNYPSVDKANLQEYYTGVYKIKKKTREDLLALGAVMGELLRKEINGRWILEKWYGTYNPYYKPMIALPNRKLQSPYDKLDAMLKWKQKDIKHFFFTDLGHGSLDVLKEADREVIELQ